MTDTLPGFLLVAGLILFVSSLFAGGVRYKDIHLPALSTGSRWLIRVLGIVLFFGGSYLYWSGNILPLEPPPPAPEPDDRSQRVAELLDARKTQLEGVRFQVTHSQSCTKGTSGGRKRATLSAQCPTHSLRQGEAKVVKEEGGCYGPELTEQGATGLVSQTGKGRSACRLVVTCQLRSATIAGRLSDDNVLLSSATKSNFQLLKDRLQTINYPNITVPAVNCH